MCSLLFAIWMRVFFWRMNSARTRTCFKCTRPEIPYDELKMCNGRRTMCLGHPTRHILIQNDSIKVKKRSGETQTKLDSQLGICELIIINNNNWRIDLHACQTTYAHYRFRKERSARARPRHFATNNIDFNSTQTHTISLYACRTIACRYLIALHSAITKVRASGFLCSPHAICCACMRPKM